MILAAYILNVAAALMAFAVVTRRSAFRPLAWLLAWEVALDLGKRALKAYVLDPARAEVGTPFVGWARVAFHAHQALQLSWHAAVVAVAVRVLLRRWSAAPVLALLAAVAVAVAGYPEWLRGEGPLGAFYAAVQVGEVVACGAVVAVAMRRPEPPKLEHAAVFWIVAVEIAVLLPVFVGGIFTWWPVAAELYMAMHAGLIVTLGGWLWTTAPASRR